MKLSVISSLLITLLINGCGSDSSKNNDTDSQSKHVGEVKRGDINDNFQLPNQSDTLGSKDNGEGLEIIEDSSSYYIALSHNETAKNIQFFIDNDNNSKTGYLKEGGVDLIVENGQLYIPEGDKGLTWKKYTDTSNFAYSTGESKDIIKLSKSLVKDPYFGAKAQVLDNDWYPVLSSPKLDTLPKTYYKIDITSSWEDYTQSDNSSVKLYNDGDSLDIKYSANSFVSNTQIFIDTDQSNGFVPKSDDKKTPLWKNFAADYLLSNAKLYSYDESLAWPWKYQEDVPYNMSGESKSFSIKRASLNNPQDLKLVVVTNNSDWSDIKAVPQIDTNGEVPSYSMK